MYVTPAQFIIDLPEFDTSAVTDPTAVQFSPGQIQFWINIAVLMLNPQRWDDTTAPPPTMLDFGVEMFVAHNLVLEAVAQRGTKVGGIPGMATGIKAAQAAGDVSVSYDTGSVLEMGAGHWNYTIYGKRFARLYNMAGMGPIQVGPGCGSGAGAWAGPWPWNFPNPVE